MLHRTIRSLALLAGVSLFLFLPGLSGQTATGGSSDVGILVMAHGGIPEWDRAVVEAVEPLKQRVPTALALGMADPVTLQAALDSLQSQGATTVAVVRLFLSGESFLHDTEFYLGLRDDAPAVTMAMMMSQAGHGGHGGHGSHGAAAGHGAHGGSGDHGSHGAAGHGAAHGTSAAQVLDPPRQLERTAEILLEQRGLSEVPLTAEIVADRARQVSTDPAGESVIVIAHGMGDDGEDQRVLDNMIPSLDALRAQGYAAVHAATLREDWPEAREKAEADIRAWVEGRLAAGDRVIVVPFRLFGFGGYAEVLEGLDHVPADGLLPHPVIAEWVARSAAGLFCSHEVTHPLGSCASVAGR